jgi:hypothetical protein
VNVVILCRRHNTVPRVLLDAPELEHVVVVAEAGQPQVFGRHVEVRAVDDLGDTTAVRRAVRDVLRDRPVDRLLAPFERDVAEAGYLRSHFGIPGPDFETSLGFADKFVMKRRLAAPGCPSRPSGPRERSRTSRRGVPRRTGRSW